MLVHRPRTRLGAAEGQVDRARRLEQRRGRIQEVRNQNAVPLRVRRFVDQVGEAEVRVAKNDMGEPAERQRQASRVDPVQDGGSALRKLGKDLTCIAVRRTKLVGGGERGCHQADVGAKGALKREAVG